jgi:hypothetical protein
MKDLEIKIIYPEQFKSLSYEMHKRVFNEEYPRQEERIDFACIFFYQENPIDYVTCYEHNSEVLYIQFRGIFSEYKNRRMVFVSYNILVEKLLEKYQFLTTRIENENIPMLKLALKCGWKIIGTFLSTDKKLLVELSNSRKLHNLEADSVDAVATIVAKGDNDGNAKANAHGQH